MEIQKIINLVEYSYKKHANVGFDVEVKSVFNYVTSVDLAIEKELKIRLGELNPDFGFICEESGEDIKEYNWIIDPIDGTANFLRGLNHTVSVALVKNNESLIGVVYDPLNNTTYFAEKGKGAFSCKEGIIERLSLDNRNNDRIVLGFGIPYNKTKLPKILNYVNNVIEEVADIKRIGPASRDICLVAEGKIDGYFEIDLKPWDIAAASLILEEAGGSFEINGDLTLAMNKNVEKCVKDLLFKSEWR